MPLSDAAIISASQLDKAIDAWRFEPQEIAAEANMKTHPVVEWRTDQSESDMPKNGRSVAAYRNPICLLRTRYASTRSAADNRAGVVL